MNYYDWADSTINSSPRYSTGFTQLLSNTPYFIPQDIWQNYTDKLILIRYFQKACLKLFRDALINNTPQLLIHWLINETTKGFGIDFHQSLEDKHFTLPIFFRTDEVDFGCIVEIQCPGSLWGDLQLTYDFLTLLGFKTKQISPAFKFTTQLGCFLQTEPIIHHLLDNSSGPACMRYFIEKTRPAVKYCGIDYKIKPDKCNFIRSHSFYGLCGDNDFRSRLSRVGNGIKYDLPPHILFDQKATLVLPFWSLTRQYFSDEIRKLFAFSTPLLPNGIELNDGSVITIEDFSNLSNRRRAFYLKYAGMDVSKNWGSKSVFRLSNYTGTECLILLKSCLENFAKGQIWLLQEEVKHEDNVSFINRDNSISSDTFHSKFSAFYGPYSLIGILATHRKFYKVHGQYDTVENYVLSNDDIL